MKNTKYVCEYSRLPMMEDEYGWDFQNSYFIVDAIDLESAKKEGNIVIKKMCKEKRNQFYMISLDKVIEKKKYKFSY